MVRCWRAAVKRILLARKAGEPPLPTDIGPEFTMLRGTKAAFLRLDWELRKAGRAVLAALLGDA